MAPAAAETPAQPASSVKEKPKERLPSPSPGRSFCYKGEKEVAIEQRREAACDFSGQMLWLGWPGLWKLRKRDQRFSGSRGSGRPPPGSSTRV